MDSGISKEDAVIYAVGRKGKESLQRRGYDIAEDFSDVIDGPIYRDAMDIGNEVLEAFKNQGSEALQNLINYVQNFDPAPLIAALTRVFDVIGGIVSVLWKMKGLIIPLIVGIEAYKVAMMGLTSIMKIVNVVKALFTGMGGLNAVMLASPVTWIALLIAGVVMIIVALWRHIEVLKTSFEGLWKKLQSNSIGQFISGVLTPLHNSLAAILNIIDSFKNGGLSDGFKAIGKAANKCLFEYDCLSYIPNLSPIKGKIVSLAFLVSVIDCIESILNIKLFKG